jgi:ABC-type nitrate/sulfonate/bicarbonate transport system permease component
MLPSPVDVARAFVSNFGYMLKEALTTVQEAIYGLLAGIGIAFVIATLMDRCKFIYRAFYPLLVISQTVPTVAIAPLLVLWMGYGMAPRIVLVIITTFFPIAIGLLDGYRSVDDDCVNLLRSMGASKAKTFRLVRLPSALPSFFSGLRVAASYSVVGALIAEWLGGNGGLGVYMTRVKKAYAFDRMFAVIVFICILSLVLMLLVALIEKIVIPHKVKKG